jgi:hypothetical protein
VQVSLLGALAIRDDAGAPVELAGTRLRLLVARLALDAGHPVGADALIEAVWGATPPAGALNALQTLVSRLRRAVPVPLTRSAGRPHMPAVSARRPAGAKKAELPHFWRADNSSLQWRGDVTYSCGGLIAFSYLSAT